MRRTLGLLVVLTGCATLRRAPDHGFVPVPRPTTPLEVCWLETGGTVAGGGFGSAGSSKASTWEATSGAILVRHPKGDLLIDTGNSLDAEAEAQELGLWSRFIFHQTAGRNEIRGKLRELVTIAGVEHLKAIVLSHAHADHAGGVTQFPGVQVWLDAREKAFVEAALRGEHQVVMPAHARSLADRMVAIPFEPKAFASFDQSWDVFGDGAVVVVPTPGHTPGSVSTFVNIDGRRLLHVGDVINLRESVERGAPKGWVMSSLTDEDEPATELQVAKLVQLQGFDPGLQIIAAHDRPSFEALFGAMPKVNGGPRCIRSEGLAPAP